MYRTAIGELHIDFQIFDKVIADVMPPVIGNQGSSWQLANIDLTPYAGDTVILRIHGSTGGGWASLMHLASKPPHLAYKTPDLEKVGSFVVEKNSGWNQ